MPSSDNPKHDDDRVQADLSEQTPLLANGDVATAADPTTATSLVEDNASKRGDDESMPKVQVFLLCWARLVEPIVAFTIFPFVSQMVRDNGNLPESEVGFYTGLIESLFSLTQMCVMLFWGRASDRLGRKPVLVTSMVGITVITSCFGLSRTIWQMILLRCLGGIFGGSVVTVRTMLTELCTPKTQARIFSLFMFTSNLGILLGPLIGGILADPAGQYGGVFKRIPFFAKYPYALPTFATGIISLSATITTILFVKETLPPKKAVDNEAANGKAREDRSSTRWMLRQPGVRSVLYLYAHIMLLAHSYTAIVPVVWFTPVSLGGFGFTPFYISMFMAVTGASQAIWVLLIFPPLQLNKGNGFLLRACGIGWLYLFSLFPLFNLLLRHADAQHVQWERTLFWIAAPVALSIGVGVSMAFAGIQLALNNVSPSHETLGTLNGLALSIASGVRAFSPAAFNSLFAFGVQRQILGGQFIWVIMLAIAATYAVLVRWLPPNAEAKVKDGDAMGEREQQDERTES